MKSPFLSYIFSLTLFYCVTAVHLQGQSNSLGDDSSIQDSLHKGPRPDDVVYEEGDFDPPPIGGIMTANVKNMQKASQKITNYLATAPNDSTGKQSSWYPQLQTWKNSFDQFLANPQQTTLFSLIPTMANFVARGMEENPSPIDDATLGQIGVEMTSNIGDSVIRAMGAYVSEQQGNVSPSNLANFVRIFAVKGFVQEGSWEEEPMPIDAAGVMILDATAVTDQLKSSPWQQAKQFLNAPTANKFFYRYSPTGNGLAILKTKYAADQSAINAKFDELKTWIEQQSGNN